MRGLETVDHWLSRVCAAFGVDHYWLVWLVSFALMPLLYLPCRAFPAYKRRSTRAWVP